MKQLFSLIFSKLLAALPKVIESNESFYRQQIIILQRVLLSKGVKRILATPEEIRQLLAIGKQLDHQIDLFSHAGAQDMVTRLKDFAEVCFLFLENPQIEPTNNLAEREIRHCVIDRRITQGTRGKSGQRWCERIWTVMATCARQRRDAFAFITESIRSYYAGEPQPSLLPIK